MAAFGAALLALGLVVDARRVLTSYVTAYATGLTIVLGALALVLISHTMFEDPPFAALRNRALGVTAALPALVLLSAPILVGIEHLYPWAGASAGEFGGMRHGELGHPYLTVPFFLLRTVIYLVTWLALATLVAGWSRDTTGGADFVAVRRRGVSAGGLVALAITATFASFDWLMSLTPLWYSAAFGVHVSLSGLAAALALVAVLARMDVWRTRSAAVEDVTADRVGKLLLVAVGLWAYSGWSQFLIIWSADLPREVAWYVPRALESWRWLALTLVLGHFAIPALLLLFRGMRRPRPLSLIGAWLLLMHYLDMYWLVLPELNDGPAHAYWLDLAALGMVAGAALAFVVWWSSRRRALSGGKPVATVMPGRARQGA